MTAVLVLDLSSFQGGVGVAWGDQKIVRELPDQRRHAEAVIPSILAVLEKARMTWDQVGAIGVSVGPGSFTGIRVGLAAAQGLALSQDIPLTGVGSLDILARACYDVCNPFVGDRICALQDVRRGEAAIRVFEVTALGLDPVSEMEILNVTQTGIPGNVRWVSGEGEFPGAEGQAFLPTGTQRVEALLHLTQGDMVTGAFRPAVPAYARSANAKVPKSAR